MRNGRRISSALILRRAGDIVVPVNRRQFLLAASAACVASGQGPSSSAQVIVISIDGFPAFELNDASVPLPTIRRLAREGAVATDGMQTVNPAVTWPNHTSMVTGVTPAKHGLLYNGLPVRGGEGKPLRVEPWVPKEELVLAPTVYDLAHAAGLTTAEIDWVAIHQAKDHQLVFCGAAPRRRKRIPREMIAAGMVTEAEIRDFAKRQIIVPR